MHRGLIFSLGVVLALSGAACQRGQERAADTQRTEAAKDTRDRDHVEVTGCLTANRETNQFVLTANTSALASLTNRAGAGEAETFHYQLVGGNDLPSYIGKEVVVTGSIEGDGKDVNLESKEKSTEPPQPAGSRDQVTPAVESREEIEMQVERLNVATIAATGAPCQAGGRR